MSSAPDAPHYVTSGVVRLTRPQLIGTMLGLLLAASSITVTGQIDTARMSGADLFAQFLPILLPIGVMVVPFLDFGLAVLRRMAKLVRETLAAALLVAALATPAATQNKEHQQQAAELRMLQEQQRIGNALRLAVLDELALQLEPVRIGNETEPPHVERAHYSCDGSKVSMPFFTSAMNWISRRTS